jgi:hypothetical protein
MIKKQFTLYLENRPGALANVTRKLAKAEVNIEGISVSESTDVGLVQLVVSNAGKTRRILTDSKVPFTVQQVVLLKLKDCPGALYEGIAKLAKAGVNINYIYATGCACRRPCDCYAVISAPDLRAVERAWSGR